MWTSSIAAAARTSSSPPCGPAQSRTSIGRSRLPPASRVAAASSPKVSPCPATAARSSSSASPRRAGSQRLEASRTAVTGGGTEEGRVIAPRFGGLWPPEPRNGGWGSPADAAVDRDDPASEHGVADRFEARPVHLLGQAAGAWEAADRLGQVGVGLRVAGEGSEQRHDAVEPEREEDRERRPGRLGDL